MARSNSSMHNKSKRKNLKAHFDEDNIRKTRHPEKKDYAQMHIDEAKTPFPRNTPPVDADTLRERLNAELERRGNDSDSTDHDDRDRNQNTRNRGGRSGYLNKLCSRNYHTFCAENDNRTVANNDENSHQTEPMDIDPASNTTQPGGSGMHENSDHDVSNCTFEERRRRFYAQEYKIAKRMLESFHEFEDH